MSALSALGSWGSRRPVMVSTVACDTEKPMDARARLNDAHLYLVCDVCDDTFLDAALSGGVDVVQLRAKRASDDEIVTAGRRFAARCAAHGALFILNDRPDLVAASGAAGVHVGQDDASVAGARALVGAESIVGLSTHTPQQIAAAVDVDYIGVGPVHATPTQARPRRRRPRAHHPRRRPRGPAVLRHRRDPRRQRRRRARRRCEADRGRSGAHRGDRPRSDGPGTAPGDHARGAGCRGVAASAGAMRRRRRQRPATARAPRRRRPRCPPARHVPPRPQPYRTPRGPCPIRHASSPPTSRASRPARRRATPRSARCCSPTPRGSGRGSSSRRR